MNYQIAHEEKLEPSFLEDLIQILAAGTLHLTQIRAASEIMVSAQLSMPKSMLLRNLHHFYNGVLIQSTSGAKYLVTLVSPILRTTPESEQSIVCQVKVTKVYTLESLIE